MRDRIALAAIALLISGEAVSAATYVVRPGGDGDFPTIQSAIDAALDGDIIQLTTGTFTGSGNRGVQFFGKAITVRSALDDPTTCIIDCEDFAVGFLFMDDETSASILRGVTIRRGRSAIAGGIRIRSSDPTIINCHFIENTCATGFGGGGINASISGATIRGCLFERNFTALGGGGIWCENAPGPTIEDCVFRENRAVSAPFGSAGAIYVEECAPSILGCTIYRNEVDAGSGAISWIHGAPMIRDCTIVENVGTTGMSSGPGSFGRIENSIIAFNTCEQPIYDFSPVELVCCDLFGNSGGDWVDGLEGQLGVDGNVSVDPLFCGPEESAWTLRDDSPCAADNSLGCGQIGAWGVGCGAVPVETTSWGRLKADFR